MFDNLKHGCTRDELDVITYLRSTGINSQYHTPEYIGVDRHDTKAKNTEMMYQVRNICAPRDDSLGPIETAAGEYDRSFNNWFVPVPPQDYRAQKQRLAEQCSSSKEKYLLQQSCSSVVCKIIWQGTNLSNLNL